MNDLFFALWKGPGRKVGRRDPWLDPPPPGVARLLAAAVAIGAAAWLLDHAGAIEGKAGTLVTASDGFSQEGRWK